MSDADRLHAAADRLDGSAEEFTAVTTQSKATAALLRAVADESSNIEWISRTMSDGHPSLCVSDSWKAALALADTILGVGDE